MIMYCAVSALLGRIQKNSVKECIEIRFPEQRKPICKIV